MNTARQRYLNLMRMVACLVLCALTVGYAISRRRVVQLDRQQDLAYGCCTLDQIVKRSEVVCRTLVPDIDEIEFTAEKRITTESTRGSWRGWSVECRDRAGQDLANMTWNAESGQLVLISSNEHTQHLTSASPAVYVTGQFRNWLRLLGMTAAWERWDVRERAQLTGTTWQLDLRRGDEAINMKYSMRLGQLIVVRLHLSRSGISVSVGAHQ